MSQYQRKYPRQYPRWQCIWTPAENALLRRLFRAKTPMDQIGEQLGRSRRSVDTQLRELGVIRTPVQQESMNNITDQDRAWMAYWRLPRDQRLRLRQTFGDHPTFSPPEDSNSDRNRGLTAPARPERQRSAP